MSESSSDNSPTRAIDEILRTTRSVRRRIDFDRPVEARVIEECIDIATQAPTGLPPESWRFLVLTDPAPKQALAALYRSALETLARTRGGPAGGPRRPGGGDGVSGVEGTVTELLVDLFRHT